MLPLEEDAQKWEGSMKVLIVDDSALMRRHLRDILGARGGHEVMLARNGLEALEALESFCPDVITLDINMPEMDGITCLSHIMTTKPTPVVMVSSITEQGAEVTFQALAMGAVDFIHKPEGTISLNVEMIEREIQDKVKAAKRARVRRTIGLRDRLRAQKKDVAPRVATKPRPMHPARTALRSLSPQEIGVVLIGISTGGPGTLEDMLPKLPASFPWPIVVAQHMPSSFTDVFARRLNELCEMVVVEASTRMPLEPGVVYIGKGDADVLVASRGKDYVVHPVPASGDYLWHPSVSRLVDSAMRALPPQRLVGVMMTGMGNDGAAEMTELRNRGGRTIAQNEDTCVVYGMPNELIEKGGADLVLPPDRIANQLGAWLPS